MQLRPVPHRLVELTNPISRRVRHNRRRILDANLPAGMGLVALGRADDDVEVIVGCRVDLVPASDLKAAIASQAG